VDLCTNPKEKITDAKSLLPSEKLLEDVENLDLTTEVIQVKNHCMSNGLLAYLRSTLMMKNYEEDDRDFIMVTVPRVLNFELMVLDFAIKLLIEWAKLPENKYFMESSVSQD